MPKPSTTKTSSIRRSPIAKRLLLDTDIKVAVGSLLQAVGFRVLFAFRVNVNIHDDTAILRWARRHQCILVCHDKHKDKKTRLELFPEVYRNGGQILRIGGTPDQDPLVSLGKVLVHIEEWREFFDHSDGTFLVAKYKSVAIPPDKMLAQVQGIFDIERATGQKAIKPSRRRKRQPKGSSTQIHMPIPESTGLPSRGVSQG